MHKLCNNFIEDLVKARLDGCTEIQLNIPDYITNEPFLFKSKNVFYPCNKCMNA